MILFSSCSLLRRKRKKYKIRHRSKEICAQSVFLTWWTTLANAKKKMIRNYLHAWTCSLMLSLCNSWCQSFNNRNARQYDLLTDRWQSWIMGKWFCCQTKFMEHVTIVWIPPWWVSQGQEMIVDKWCHQTGTSTAKYKRKQA